MATDRVSVQSPNLLRHAWSGWNSFWSPDSLAMVIMLALCYEFFNIVSWILAIHGLTHRLARFGPSGPWPFMRHQHWPQVLLSLFCAIWTPLIVSFHPLVTKECVFGVENIPNDYQVVYQILVFIIAEYLMRLLFIRSYPIYSTDEPMDAHGLATTFTLQQATLLLAIMTIQGLSQIGINSILGHVHIIAIAGWIFFRQISATLTMQVSWLGEKSQPMM